MFSHIKELFTRPSGYQISRSVRLRSSASAYLNRTPASASNRQKYTLSFWFKRGTLSTNQALFSASDGTQNNEFLIYLGTGDTINIQQTVSGSSAGQISCVTNAVFRDPSAWYHMVLAIDTTQATSTNRLLLYINGVAQTFSSYSVGSSINTWVDNTNPHALGKRSDASLYFDGYMTEVNFIDGQALTPSSFGETDTLTGVWKPKKYAGTYGTNGFYLNFSDNSAATATTIGKDYSGNGNNWTPNNISVTAGVTYDSMLDVPTLYADGGNGRGNYATLNPLLYASASGYRTLSNGNLTTVGNSATNNGNDYSTQTVKTGLWYAEFTCSGASGVYPQVGIISVASAGSGGGQVGYTADSCNYSADGTKKVDGAANASYGSSFTTNDVIGVAVDCDNGAIYFSKNNTWQNSGVPTSGASKTGAAKTWTGGSIEFYFALAEYQAATGWSANFGQRPFTYTPPTGFKALNTQNLPAPTISNGAQYMAASTYTGTGATQSIVNSGNNAAGISFQPDFVWIKDRSAARSHRLFDAVRGATKALFSDATDAETTLATDLTAFNSNGFTLGAGAGSNSNTETFVGWQWKASGSTVSNTSGSITSTVSAGATQGFSVVTWTGNGTNGATVGHSLGVAPKMVIVKRRSAIESWGVYHASLPSAAYYLILNSTAAQDGTGGTIWNSTAPSSTVLTLGTSTYSNANTSTYVAYCFAEVAGYSKFGKYTGNGNSSDGPFVYLGFRPRWLMTKRTDSTGSWLVVDSARNTYNIVNGYLVPNTSDAEGSATWGDFTANGFKLRGTTHNGSGESYIYAAFAENPFKLSLAR